MDEELIKLLTNLQKSDEEFDRIEQEMVQQNDCHEQLELSVLGYRYQNRFFCTEFGSWYYSCQFSVLFGFQAMCFSYCVIRLLVFIFFHQWNNFWASASFIQQTSWHCFISQIFVCSSLSVFRYTHRHSREAPFAMSYLHYLWVKYYSWYCR